MSSLLIAASIFLSSSVLPSQFLIPSSMVRIALQSLSAVIMVNALTNTTTSSSSSSSSSSSPSTAPTTTAPSTGGPTLPYHTLAPAGMMNNVTCTVNGDTLPVVRVTVPNTAALNLTWSCPGFNPRAISGSGVIGNIDTAMFVDRKLPSSRLSANKITVTGEMRAYQNFVGNHTVGFYLDQNTTRYKAFMDFIIEENPSAGNLTLFGPESDIFRVRRGEAVTVNLTVKGSGNKSYPSLVCFVSSVTEDGKTTVNRDLGTCSDLVDFNGVNSENYDRMQVNVTFKAKKDTAMEAAHLCFAAGDKNWVSPLDYNMGNGTYHGNVLKGVQCLNYIVEGAAPTTAPTSAPTIGPTAKPVSYSPSVYGFVNALVFGVIFTLLAQ
ncbi:hypothetical protein FOL46_005570 [Perkinsus olseni]|uniref:Uncharacterized protein n=1 Tax=Perkinsus olseni TaxID=32597 RepID=A0A7J6MRM0_PEROL|nr:hypothetical protein FOL46_005570 [Perkinsus olseni]